MFVDSDYLKDKLSYECQRFKQIDANFSELRMDMQEERMVREICNVEGRRELLEEFYDQIQPCEKALRDYLRETKKSAYPNALYVSYQALYNVLANGTNANLHPNS